MTSIHTQAPLADLMVTAAIQLSEETALEAFVEAERELQLRIRSTFEAAAGAGSTSWPADVEGELQRAEERLRARPRARALARRWALSLLKNRRRTPGSPVAWRYAIAIPLLVQGRATKLDAVAKRFGAVFKTALEGTGFADVETQARPTPYVTSGKLRTLTSAEMLGLFCGQVENDYSALQGAGRVRLVYFMLAAGALPDAARHPNGTGGALFTHAANAALGRLPRGLKVQVGAPVFPGFAAIPAITPAYGEYIESAVRCALDDAGGHKDAVVVVRAHGAGYVELVLQASGTRGPVQLTPPEMYCEPASYVLEFCGVAAVNAGAQVRCEDACAWIGAPASLQ